ncbi:unnamed protein product [Acanthosepion pharaonis]|uniref:Uncharacterized protein n=1 Tax=Acanthosepion pharaonis TaxID=158019 RepID=A0A812AM19_ACAPH|nr:unnamed protein product [Sepia pharaonis]
MDDISRQEMKHLSERLDEVESAVEKLKVSVHNLNARISSKKHHHVKSHDKSRDKSNEKGPSKVSVKPPRPVSRPPTTNGSAQFMKSLKSKVSSVHPNYANLRTFLNKGLYATTASTPEKKKNCTKNLNKMASEGKQFSCTLNMTVEIKGESTCKK